MRRFTGPTLLALSIEDPGAAARLMKDFGKDAREAEGQALAIGGELMGPELLSRSWQDCRRLDEARAMLLGTMLAPMSKLAQTLNEVPGKLVRTVRCSHRIQKERRPPELAASNRF